MKSSLCAAYITELIYFPLKTVESVFLFVLCPTTGQVQHKAFFKVGPDAGMQPTHIRQNPKIPSAPSAFPQWGTSDTRKQNSKQLVL